MLNEIAKKQGKKRWLLIRCYLAESHDKNDNCGRIQLRLQKQKAEIQ
jgi:hypothetical protein